MIPAVIVGGLVIGTIIYSMTKTTSNKESETALPERRNNSEIRRETQPINPQQSQREEKSTVLEFCSNCGAKITDTMNNYCPSCGNPLE